MRPDYGNLVGKVFSRLTVVSLEKIPGARPKWICRCECGAEKKVNTSHLVKGTTRSCGCLMLGTKNAEKHGRSRVPEYGPWYSMKRRCYDEKSINYEIYGGRGITVCDRWLNSIENFCEDMGPRPSLDHSIDRINNDGNYEPGNCHWATREDQGLNTRQTRKLVYRGVTYNTKEASETFGIPADRIRERLHRNWTVERTLETSLRRRS